MLKVAGATIALASPQGGQPSIDPKSDLPENLTELMKRIRTDITAQAELANTKKLADVLADDCQAVFFPGGHGPMWDKPDNAISISLIEAFVNANKPVAAPRGKHPSHLPCTPQRRREPSGLIFQYLLK